MPLEQLETGDKSVHLAKYIRGKTRDGKALTDWLVKICDDNRTKVSDRIRAIELLFNRGWGKPKEELTITINARPLQEFTITELRQMLGNSDEFSEGNRDSTSSTVDAEFVEISPKMPELTGDTQEC